MPIYELHSDRIEPLEQTTFAQARISERQDLQRLLRDQINVVLPDVMVLSEEFGEWEASRRRIDLLGLDRDANLVVFELKRTEDGGHMELQAVRYAAMVSAMTFDKAVEAHADYLRRRECEGDAEAEILKFLEWDEPDEESFAQDVRIVLVSAEFGKELTTAVMWLNDHGLDIRCVRLRPYGDGSRIFLDVQQVIPLPEAEQYQIQIKEKVAQERSARRGKAVKGEHYRRFWASLLERAAGRTTLHGNVSPGGAHWLSTGAGRSGFGYQYALGKHKPRVELKIDIGDELGNKQLFDQLHESSADIDAAYGRALNWERKDGKQACYVRSYLSPGTWREEDRWDEIHNEMIEAMIRLEEAFRPHVTGLDGHGRA